MGFLDAFGGAGASVEDITAGRSTVAGESIDHGEDQRQAIAETAAAISAQQQQDAQNFMQPQKLRVWHHQPLLSQIWKEKEQNRLCNS